MRQENMKHTPIQPEEVQPFNLEQRALFDFLNQGIETLTAFTHFQAQTLKKMGFEKIWHLASLSEETLQEKLKGSPITVAIVKRALFDKGLKLGDKNTPKDLQVIKRFKRP